MGGWIVLVGRRLCSGGENGRWRGYNCKEIDVVCWIRGGRCFRVVVCGGLSLVMSVLVYRSSVFSRACSVLVARVRVMANPLTALAPAARGLITNGELYSHVFDEDGGGGGLKT